MTDIRASHPTSSMSDSSSLDKIQVLQARSELMQDTRRFFLERDFFEVDTAVLSSDTVVDRYLDPIEVRVDAGGSQRPMFLQTSPEFAMKRLVASGAKAIFQLGKSFRQGEAGRMHQPEFTMLEWYRVGDNYEQGRQILDELVQFLLGTGPALQLTYQEAFRKYSDVDPFQDSDQQLLNRLFRIEGWKDRSDFDSHPQNDRDGILNLLMSEVIEPSFANEEAILIFDWPASQAALAKIRDGSPPVAERFEYYVRGVELANGYHELTDANELERRNKVINECRIAEGRNALPPNSRLLKAMKSGLPNCCGTALGFDRLMMLKAGRSDIRDVIPFDLDQA